jgi:hypothetical protein
VIPIPAFDSDALQVAGIPLSDISGTDGRVHFEIKGDQSTTVFAGAIMGDAISGTFTDGGDKGGFELVRAALSSTRIRTREATFQNHDVTLVGTLFFPTTPGKHHAIIFYTVQDLKAGGLTT